MPRRKILYLTLPTFSFRRHSSPLSKAQDLKHRRNGNYLHYSVTHTVIKQKVSSYAIALIGERSFRSFGLFES